MKTKHCNCAAWCFATLLLLVCCVKGPQDVGAVDGLRAPELTAAEQQEYEQIQKRLKAREEEVTGACFHVCDLVDPNEVRKVDKTLNLVPAFVDPSQIEKIIEAGGVARSKDSLASLLKNKNPVIRGFGALTLGCIGDPAYKKEIAKLLDNEVDELNSLPADEWLARKLRRYDRGQAAMALGLLGGKEYVVRIASLLTSDDPNERAGAARGLGYLGAKDRAPDIAKCLSDEDINVKFAGIWALAEFGATRYAGEVVRLLVDRSDVSLSNAASYALAKLQARERAKGMAVLLADPFRKADTAKALALLGAKEYQGQIAQMMKDGQPLVRRDALLALGILGITEYRTNIAAHLQDSEGYVRNAAAVALLLLGDQDQHTTKAVSDQIRLITGTNSTDISVFLEYQFDFDPVAADMRKPLVTRAIQSWERILRSEKMLPTRATDAPRAISHGDELPGAMTESRSNHSLVPLGA